MNLIELLQDNQIDYRETHRHVQHGWVGVDCPWCGPDTGKFHLGINLAGGFSSCWRCGPQNTVEVLSEVLDVNKAKAWALFKQLDYVAVQTETTVKGRIKLPEGSGQILGAHRRYLIGRGFDPDEIVRLWGVQGISIAPTLSWRLLIPVVWRSQIVSWTTRSLSDNVRARYISAPPQSESRRLKTLLYGEDYARFAVIICEGPLDVWRVGPGAVATFGTAVTSDQIVALAKYPVRVICFDRGAERQSCQLADELSIYDGETYRIELETGDDPGSASMEEIQELRERFGLKP